VAYNNLRSPFRGEDIKPVMSYLRQNRLNGHLIYVYYGAKPAFEFYAPLYGLAGVDYRVGVSARTEPKQYGRDIDGLKGHQRVWFVVSHNCSWCAVNEESYCVQQFEHSGMIRDGVRFDGASIYLYDLMQSPGAG
jgi:hypothetical protein